jgi:hypothetical protein
MSEVKTNRVFARSHARELTSEERTFVSGGDAGGSWCYGITGGGSDTATVPGDDIVVTPNQ